ncbi:MAG TPA: helix-turn-helix transcriptional regulator [Dermatophilaceae bacterium]|nr:helix-turn-helix transcriptional regulator [Dermatophilaceae bacterium]
MWEVRAQRAQREIAALATSGLDLAELHAAVLAVVHRTVPFPQACWAAVDPSTMLMTSVTNWPPWPVPEEYALRFAESEYAGSEPNPFTQLSRRSRPVTRLSDAPHRETVRSVRLNDLLRPQGLEHELRAVFLVDGFPWAVGTLFREPGPDFSEREVEFLAAVAETVAGATRVALREPGRAAGVGGGPVIVLVGPHGELRAATRAAESWLADTEAAAPGRFAMTLYAVAASAGAAPAGTARTRMRDGAGNWVVLQASRLIAGDAPEQLVVTVEPATTAELVHLLLAAYGATAREGDVCLEVLAGRSTQEVADRLFISPHTVHDHLKALFLKVGVRSRGELVARLQG